MFAFALGELPVGSRETTEKHLAGCPDCRAVLAQAELDLANPGGENARPADSSKHIGRYELLELLGAGASGVVYRALDPELARVVALKLLRNEELSGTAQAKERTQREARAMAQLSHANVVTVFDVGLEEAGVYIVMEYIPGTTLEQWLVAAPRSSETIVEAFISAGRGLSAAHAKRLIHRDFKPENVLVGQDGVVRVSDFGLARSLGETEPGALEERKRASVATYTRGVFGTPAYMAPELFDGKPADARSDQFSFGVALLAALMGRHPFGASGGITVSELVLRMNARSIDFSGTNVEPRLRDVLLRAVNPVPEARFADMPSLIGALQRALHPALRKRTAVAAALGVLFALGVVAFALGRSPERPNARSAPTRVASRPALVRASATLAPPGSSARAPAPNEPARSSAQKSKPHRPSAGRKRYNDQLRDPF